MFKKAKENKKGFTLAELLIVVAIIAVLVAISIPIFNSQLEKSRDAADAANIRAAYAEATAAYISDENATKSTVYAYKFTQQGTDATWSQGTDFKIADLAVTPVVGAKSVWFKMGESGCVEIKLSTTDGITDGAQNTAFPAN